MEGSLGSLIVEIKTKTDELKSGLENGQKQIESFAADSEISLAALAAAFATMAVAAAVAIAKITDESIKYGTELDKLSKLSNATASSIASLSYAIQEEHGSVETLTRTIPMLARNMEEAATGNKKFKDAFDQLGVRLRDANGNLKTTDEILLEIADGVSKSTDKTAAMAQAMEVLGRGGRDLIPILEKGRVGIQQLRNEFDNFGFSGSKLDEFAKKAKEVDAVFISIRTKFQLAGAALSAELLPEIEQLAKDFLAIDWISIAVQIGKIADAFLRVADAVYKLMGSPLFKMMGQMQSVAGLAGGIQTGATGAPAMLAGFKAAIFGGTPTVPGQNQGQQGAPQQQGQAGAQPQGAGSQAQNPTLEAMMKGLSDFETKLKATLLKSKEHLKSFSDYMKDIGGQISDALVGAFNNAGDAIGTSFAQWIVEGKSFSDSLKAGFQSMAEQFIAAIVSMIVKWVAFIAAVMTIAVILQAFGVPIGATFKAAFSLLQGGDSSSALSGLAKSAAHHFLFFREGGAMMARNGLMTAAYGIAITSGLGEGGIPIIAHPNEIISPIDKFYDLIRDVSARNLTFNVNGYNRDPRELANAIGLEVDRKRRSP